MARTAADLTPKEELFVAEYLIHSNGARAYAAAGYKGSSETVRKGAFDLLRRPRVKAAIDAARGKRLKKLELTAEKVLGDIGRIADKAEAADEYSAALRGHELLGKHLKLFAERVELTGKDGGPLRTMTNEALDARIEELRDELGKN